MKFADCREGMRVRATNADHPEGIVGTIARCHPILKVGGRVPEGFPSFMINVVSVRYDRPLIEDGMPIVGGTYRPEDLEPLQ